MTAKLGSAVTAKVVERLNGAKGLNSGLAALTSGGTGMAAVVSASQIKAQNAAADLTERSTTATYPAFYIYCDKLANELTEKFRKFSGTAKMAIEIRHTQDRLEDLQDSLELYADAALQVLHSGRGDWGEGMFYSGAYEVSYGAVKHGGRNFVQTAKITFEIGVSRS
jgi:phosphate-selective porin